MKQQTLIVATAASVLLIAGVMTTHAHAEEESGFLLTMTEYNVKTGHNRHFRDGVAEWKDCYLENEGEANWSVWRRLQGEGINYIVTIPMENWAAMDTDDPGGEACQDVADEKVIPYLSGTTRSIARHMPEISASADDYSVVAVHYFKVSNDREFNRIISNITSVLGEAENFTPGEWYNVIGGRDAPDYFVTAQFDDMAAMDDDESDVWETYENLRGEEEANQIRAEFGQSVDEYWSLIYRRVDDLSHLSD